MIRVQKTEFLRKNHASDSFSARSSQSKDPHMPFYPMTVKFQLNHNHPILAGDVLRFRDVGDEAESKIVALLQNNHSPASALEVLKYDLQTEHPENYILLSGDRYYCPDLSWCYRLYYRIFNKDYGSSSPSIDISHLQTKLDMYNQEQAEGLEGRYTAMAAVDDGSPIIVICTPLMKRVHASIKHSGELVFMDSSGSMDRHNFRVFLMLTHSVAGGLPVGVLILPNEKETTLIKALQLYNTLLSTDSFNGRGTQGPIAFITDDSASEHLALTTVYPNSKTLLCSFHVLQAHWRYLWSEENKVQKMYRQHLFQILKDILYSNSIDSMATKYEDAMNDNIVEMHPKVKQHLQALYSRRDKWALSCRADIPKAFNLSQLLDFIVTRFDAHYDDV